MKATRLRILSPFIAIALLAPVGAIASSASATTADEGILSEAAEFTLQQMQTGLSLSVEAQEEGKALSLTNVVANPHRYDEEAQTTGGQTIRFGRQSSRSAYLSANLISLPRRVLQEANLGPTSVVTFDPRKANTATVRDVAPTAKAKFASYLAYSPAGMWQETLTLTNSGRAQIVSITSSPSPTQGTRYRVNLTGGTQPAPYATVDLDVSDEGVMTYAHTSTASGATFTLHLRAWGSDNIVFPALPSATFPWANVEAAKWRLTVQPRALFLANKIVGQATRQADRSPSVPLTTIVREQADKVARQASVEGATVKAWQIKNGSRIEIKHLKQRGFRWSAGACVLVNDNTITTTAC